MNDENSNCVLLNIEQDECIIHNCYHLEFKIYDMTHYNVFQLPKIIHLQLNKKESFQ